VGPTGRVIAFEPVPQNLEFLRRNVTANGCTNVKVEPVALSNKSEKLTFHLHRDNLAAHGRLEHPTDRAGTIDVQAITLDEYLKDDSGKINLIKIDAEGSEGHILEGMRETLRKHPEMVILMEFTPYAYRQVGYDPEAMLRQLHDQGYEINYFKAAPGRLQRLWDKQRTVPVPESQIAAFVKKLTGDAQADLLIRKRAKGGP
jgi:FkbM family methyltransferase